MQSAPEPPLHEGEIHSALPRIETVLHIALLDNLEVVEAGGCQKPNPYLDGLVGQGLQEVVGCRSSDFSQSGLCKRVGGQNARWQSYQKLSSNSPI